MGDIFRDPIWQSIGVLVSVLAFILTLIIERDKLLAGRGKSGARRPLAWIASIVKNLSVASTFLVGGAVTAILLVLIGVLLRLGSTPANSPPGVPTSSAQPAVLFPSAPVPSQTLPPVATEVVVQPTQTLSPTSTAFTPRPTTTSMPLSGGLGELTVRVPEECGNHGYEIWQNDQLLASGQTTQEGRAIYQGTYNIVLKSKFGPADVMENVEIKPGERSVVDLGKTFGILNVKGYPALDHLLMYMVSGNQTSSERLSSDYDQCGAAGHYTIVIPETYSFPSIIGTGFARYAIFGKEGFSFDVVIKPGERKDIAPANLPKQLGLISFKSSQSISMTVKVYEIVDGERVMLEDEVSLGSVEKYWMVAGTYEMTITNPFVNYPIKDIVIKPGEERVIELPDAP
jgi:hypothetical protein